MSKIWQGISEYQCEVTVQLEKHSKEKQASEETCFLYEES